MTHASADQARVTTLLKQAGIDRLAPNQQQFIQQQANRHRFTQQELRQLCDMAADLAMWGEGELAQYWAADVPAEMAPKQRRKLLLDHLRGAWQGLREKPNHYPAIPLTPPRLEQRIRRVEVEKQKLGLGPCPVASPRTRCCNLLTLDAVENCGFDCSYCSIQSFYHGDEVRFDSRFPEKLAQLEIDPDRFYHIGTGQSSDSLMWGNQGGILDALLEFARQHPNVILELKSKSKNIQHLLKRDLPSNLLCTWSLNTPTLIAHEEHLTASLDERLKCARQIADHGALIGFHLHPMIHYDNWREDYGALFQRLLDEFSADEVVLLSLGTLTYIKPVIKKLRARKGFQSKILQMPWVESDGKLSYPKATKQEMFCFAYQSLQPWHEDVFFYLCMENHDLWQPVFGYEYPTNQAFEAAMKSAYLGKIKQRQTRSET
ncbi:MAG: radical SAM protein [Candidatus Thiodiazotropha taylori]|nr:radical SAM protein [Candidatus Thiodiazotropha endolucinida]MCG8050355.1 radical SAM protein [Candidatus Thiodiazotropha taylori]MCW4229313.1 radical SAM protein [Candidatus Thiodiazotropha taylori]MCW4312173.1 radical SAM protein [Candidatus Thiodiazotropha taylori]